MVVNGGIAEYLNASGDLLSVFILVLKLYMAESACSSSASRIYVIWHHRAGARQLAPTDKFLQRY